jgi:hypothetical protein
LEEIKEGKFYRVSSLRSPVFLLKPNGKVITHKEVFVFILSSSIVTQEYQSLPYEALFCLLGEERAFLMIGHNGIIWDTQFEELK